MDSRPLRDLGNRRTEMMRIFKSELGKRKVPYVIGTGKLPTTEELVTAAINKLLRAFSKASAAINALCVLAGVARINRLSLLFLLYTSMALFLAVS